ncbi:uncharacterized protein LOC119638574 [Glossina fuscipes]|uniref:Uncharacterized protein LOC119638574 n=1 Tax=Glossina fuscipes TaxID=7396 RepID=A0A9C5Z1I7_9MUSC|nr:uncharacterized protein LOC119638574 [Glossina fuscipes]
MKKSDFRRSGLETDFTHAKKELVKLQMIFELIQGLIKTLIHRLCRRVIIYADDNEVGDNRQGNLFMLASAIENIDSRNTEERIIMTRAGKACGLLNSLALPQNEVSAFPENSKGKANELLQPKATFASITK